ncbi:protein of unknown function DUF820 [[Leptolyngbya] sp. PCC 7376]|uniref:Uma2 family endonuclease n=1 Tax=[Leptolyngbya] sp. PCC 7376 TaxID=111781 RepID=UPI00029EC600|nr:Uma2 family endonuclease [[Leptolyngbya] sp. PCC 7376]AFY36929.1 protein of unknown function DUF820 [[Leptolyngbya] sp. PCC 7376]
MIALTEHPQMTPEEYLEFEKTSDIKHEYIDGEIYSMAGTGGFHNIISGNLYILLRGKLGNSGCRTYFADMKVRLNEGRKFFYPDLLVTCDERDQPTNTYTDFPKVIVEVLSPSTASFDRGAKFGFYRSIPSLQEYILINSDTYLVECFRRQKEDMWLFQTYSGLEAIVG